VSRPGRARRNAIISLCPVDQTIIDVGADHGYVAETLNGIATERQPHRIRRPHVVSWVVADGLAPFRRVPVAVIAGMGAHTIAKILSRGPRPEVAVLHAADDPVRLRHYLSANDWRIDAEALAPEAGAYAQILRAVPGTEQASGLHLEFGPRLLENGHPLLRAHLTQLRRWWRQLATQTERTAPERHGQAAARVRFIDEYAANQGWSVDDPT